MKADKLIQLHCPAWLLKMCDLQSEAPATCLKEASNAGFSECQTSLVEFVILVRLHVSEVIMGCNARRVDLVNAVLILQVMRKAVALGSDNTWLKAKGQVDYNTQSQKARRAESKACCYHGALLCVGTCARTVELCFV